MRGAGMGLCDGQAGEGESDGHSVDGAGAAVIGPSDRASDAEEPGHLPHPDSGDQRGRGPGIDMGRCFLPVETDPRAHGEGACAGNTEKVSGYSHRRTATNLPVEAGLPAHRVHGQREAQAGIEKLAAIKLPFCAPRIELAGDDIHRPAPNLCRPLPGKRDEL